MKVTVTIGTGYCGCPSESFEIECNSIEDFRESDEYSTEILNRINELTHYFIDYEYNNEEESEED